jgi:hypothetical protein
MIPAILLAFCCASPLQRTPPPPVEWPSGMVLTAAEKHDVLLLARRVGMDAPAKVVLRRVLILGDQSLVVQSAVTVDGHERWTNQVSIVRDNWRAKNELPPSTGQSRIGHWIALAGLERVSRWRVQDGEWLVDLDLDGVPYEDARSIVLAIRHGVLVNQQTPRDAGAPPPRLPDFDASLVYAIQRDESLPDGYRVSQSTGDDTGYWIDVRIRDGQVQVIAVHSWLI